MNIEKGPERPPSECDRQLGRTIHIFTIIHTFRRLPPHRENISLQETLLGEMDLTRFLVKDAILSQKHSDQYVIRNSWNLIEHIF